MAASSTNTVVQKSEYWMRISVVVQLCSKEALLDVLHDPALGGLTRNKQQLHAILTNFKAREERNLRKIIKPFQWDMICHECHVCTARCPANCQNLCPVPCPRQGQTDSQDLDITCIVLLIRNLDKILLANIIQQAWQNILPTVNDSREIRNDLMHGSLHELDNQQKFDDFWNRIHRNLNGLGYKNMILFLALKTSSLDPYLKQRIDFLQDKHQYLEDTKAEQNELDNVKVELNILLAQYSQIKKTMTKLEDKVDTLADQTDLNREEMVHLRESVETLKTKGKLEDKGFSLESLRLKQDTREKYAKVPIDLAPQSSCRSKSEINRDEIIVNLSLINDANSTFAMEAGHSDIKRVKELKQKQKQLASTEVDYKNIVTSQDDYVIISGSPGCGKTTLTETLLYKWASNELWTEELHFDFVFVIYLRKLNRFKEQSGVTAEQILSHFYPGYDLREGQDKTLLILEGFDELSGKEQLREREDDFTNYTQAIYDLLDPNNSKLPYTRIVTSRPGSCPILFDTVLSRPFKQNKRLIEITGFSSSNIFRYVLKHFPETKKALETINQLKELPIVYDMMVIPFYCWGICFLLKNEITVEELGHTYTALFTNLLVLYIRNHGLRNQSMKLKDVLRNKKFKDICLGLAELAYLLEKKGKVVFTNEDLPENIQMEDLVNDSGLLMEIESDDIGSFSTTYQFLHYTFHEYLVALHMFQTGKIKNMVSNDSETLSMLSGLLGGSLTPSKSSNMVKEFSKLFLVEKEISLRDILIECDVRKHDNVDEILLDHLNLFPALYEYQNPVKLSLDFILRVGAGPYASSYVTQSKAYFKEHCKSSIQLAGAVKLLVNVLDVELIISILSLGTSREIFFVVPPFEQNILLQIMQFILSNDLHFDKIRIRSSRLPLDILWAVIHHCTTFVYFGNCNDLTDVLQLLEKFKETCTTRKLIFHFDIPDFNFKNVIDSIDVCEEIILGLCNNHMKFSPSRLSNEEISHQLLFNHKHDSECFEPSQWVSIKKTQRKVNKLMKQKRFTKLKTLKMSGTCVLGLFTLNTFVLPK